MLRIKDVFNVFMLVALLGMSVSSCIDDIEVQKVLPEGNLKLSFTVNGIEGDVKSRAATDVRNGESTVNDVYILFFNEAGYFQRYARGTADNNTGQLSISLEGSSLKVNENYKTLIVGNADGNTPLPDVEDGTPWGNYGNYIAALNTKYHRYEDFRKHLCSEGKCELGNLPMWGEFVDGEGKPCNFRISEDGTSVEGSVHFRRAVVRIDFTNNVEGFDISKVAVCNQHSRGFFFHEGTEASTLQNYKTVSISQIQDFNDSRIWHTAKGRRYTFYVYPSVFQNPEEYDTNTLCLMFDGKRTSETGPKYYRFNVANPNFSQQLERNKSYDVRLTNIKETSGSARLGWAYNPDEAAIIEVSDFQLNDDNTSYTIEGFDPRPRENIYGNTPNPFYFTALCNNRHYLKVTTKFDAFVDAYLSIGSAENRNMTVDLSAAEIVPYGLADTKWTGRYNEEDYTVHGNKTVEERNLRDIPAQTNGETNSKIYLNVYRTGPDDEDFKNDIIVKAYRKSDNMLVKEYKLTVNVHTSCISGDAIINNDIAYECWNFDNLSRYNSSWVTTSNGEGFSSVAAAKAAYPVYVIADRNVGTPTKAEASKSHNYCESSLIKKIGQKERTDSDIRWRGAINTFYGDNTDYWTQRWNDSPWFGWKAPWLSAWPDGMYNDGDAKGFWQRAYRTEWRAVKENNGDGHPCTRNIAFTKLRCIVISDYKDPESGNWVATYIPYFTTPIHVGDVYKCSCGYQYPYTANTSPFGDKDDPGFIFSCHGHRWSYGLNGARNNATGRYGTFNCRGCSKTVTMWIRSAATERPIRWIRSTEWNSKKQYYQPR